MCVLLLAVITLLLGGAYLPGKTLFSNDGPLSRMVSECHRLPAAFTGVWQDLNSVGYRELGALPNLTYAFRLLVHPILFSKFYAPFALLLLGLGAWYFFRQSGLTPAACILGGLAATLNSDFFSTACWGMASHTITVALTFFALALLLNPGGARGWLAAALAGLAVGMGVSEGADVGAIFSLYVAAFVLYQALTSENAPRLQSALTGAGRLAVVAIFALFLAAQSVSVLVDTQISGIAGTHQDEETREKRWDWATQWSLPKTETLGFVVPGLFGGTSDMPGERAYWGAIGRSAAWDRYYASGSTGLEPKELRRQTGSGFYAGVFVVIMALWAAVQSFRRNDSVFNIRQRKWLWFWTGVAGFSLLLAFGRFSFFYRIVYALPYLSTVRNPVKFLDLVSLALVVLFAYGVDGLWRTFVAARETAPAGPASKQSPATLSLFEKRWVIGCAVALAASVVGWIVYDSCQPSLEHYLTTVGFREATARVISEFSVRQVGWFVLFLGLSTGAMVLFFKHRLAGANSAWAAAILGLLLVADLGRANRIWVIVWDYNRKYATNPVIDFLRDKPYEHRVALAPFRHPPMSQMLEELYRAEWAQQHFPFYNIQSLDLVQLPRTPEDLKTFDAALHFDPSQHSSFRLIRRWKLTNTRYLISLPEVVDLLNSDMNPLNPQFRIVNRINIIPKPDVVTPRDPDDVTAVFDPKGAFALIEFIGALPRACLFSNWQVNTDDRAALATLVDPSFNPSQSLLVDVPVPPPSASSAANQNAGTVDFERYASRDVVLNAHPTLPSILLLNDRFDPNWKVLVDGQPTPLLRCNYLMRGVRLDPGPHRVEFLFQPSVGPLYVSLAAVGVGVVLLIAFFAMKWQPANSPQSASPQGNVLAGISRPAAVARQESAPKPRSPQRRPQAK